MVAEIIVMLNEIVKILEDVLFSSRRRNGNNRKQSMHIDFLPSNTFLISIIAQRSIFNSKWLRELEISDSICQHVISSD